MAFEAKNWGIKNKATYASFLISLTSSFMAGPAKKLNLEKNSLAKIHADQLIQVKPMKYQLANVKLYQSSTLKIVISIWTLLGPKQRSVRSVMFFVQVQPYKKTHQKITL